MDLVTVILFIFKMVNEFGLNLSLLCSAFWPLRSEHKTEIQTLLFTMHESKVLEKMQDSEKSVRCLSASLMPANII